jgi:hypothetical protein
MSSTVIRVLTIQGLPKRTSGFIEIESFQFFMFNLVILLLTNIQQKGFNKSLSKTPSILVSIVGFERKLKTAPEAKML